VEVVIPFLTGLWFRIAAWFGQPLELDSRLIRTTVWSGPPLYLVVCLLWTTAISRLFSDLTAHLVRLFVLLAVHFSWLFYQFRQPNYKCTTTLRTTGRNLARPWRSRTGNVFHKRVGHPSERATSYLSYKIHTYLNNTVMIIDNIIILDFHTWYKICRQILDWHFQYLWRYYSFIW
jgi:hypothetical protein